MNMYRAGYSEQPIDIPKNYGAGVITDAYILPTVISGTTQFYDSGGSAIALSAAKPPDHDSLAITGTTEVTILNTTGPGFLYNIITPNGDAGGSSLATVKIIIDGVTSIIDTTAGISATQRLLIGAMIDGNAAAPRLLGKIGKTPQSTLITIPSIAQVSALSQARLRFLDSCIVTIQMSVTPATNGTHGTHAMIRHTKD